jgi:hypothetical protein
VELIENEQNLDVLVSTSWCCVVELWCGCRDRADRGQRSHQIRERQPNAVRVDARLGEVPRWLGLRTTSHGTKLACFKLFC